MKTLIDSLRSLRTAFAGVLRPPITVEFPSVIRLRGVRYRASFALTDDETEELACVACLACEKICPSGVIKIKTEGKRESAKTGKKRQYADAFTLDLSACIQCELCVQVCNSDAIVMVKEPEDPVYRREDLVLDLDHLRANARDGHASWGRGTVLQEMQEPKPKPKAEPKTTEVKTAEPAPTEKGSA